MVALGQPRAEGALAAADLQHVGDAGRQHARDHVIAQPRVRCQRGHRVDAARRSRCGGSGRMHGLPTLLNVKAAPAAGLRGGAGAAGHLQPLHQRGHDLLGGERRAGELAGQPRIRASSERSAASPSSAAASAAGSPGGTRTAASPRTRRCGGVSEVTTAQPAAAPWNTLFGTTRSALAPVPKMPRQTSWPATSAGSSAAGDPVQPVRPRWLAAAAALRLGVVLAGPDHRHLDRARPASAPARRRSRGRPAAG